MSEALFDLSSAELRQALEGVRDRMLAHAREHADEIERMASEAQASVLNLLHADALRTSADRETRPKLRAQGVTTFDDAGPHAMRSVEAAIRLLGGECELSMEVPNVREAMRLTHDRADGLLGRPEPERSTRIMVTLPSDAADDPSIVRGLLERGAGIVRINCAHDDAPSWGRMIGHLEAARRETGRDCKVFMDLAGPKVRTGALPKSRGVIKFYPRRDAIGRVRRPARLLLTDHETARFGFGPTDVSVPVEGAWASSLREGETVRTVDARGKQRTMRVIERAGPGAIVSCDAAGFLVQGTRLERLAKDGTVVDHEEVGALPSTEEHILLRPGYLLHLTRDASSGALAHFDERGVMRTPPEIGCTLPEAFDHLEVGHRVLFDDGKAGGRVVRLTERGALVEIETARNNGVKLRADKGINFPDTRIDVPPLTAKDIADLDFVATHADVVGLSFVRGPEGVRQLQRELRAHGASSPGPGIVVKIETASCVERLTEVLIALLDSPGAGVMIARGDLAVELGWERLPEAQRKILWLAGAAHLPVIWATQVLESLAKKGQPTRAEVTDAAESERAACVMLNKGPFIGRAVGLLDEILRRTERESLGA